jgi:hypothetical protein
MLKRYCVFRRRQASANYCILPPTAPSNGELLYPATDGAKQRRITVFCYRWRQATANYCILLPTAPSNGELLYPATDGIRRFRDNKFFPAWLDLHLNQGDQMVCPKNRQKCSPAHILSKLTHNFRRGKGGPKISLCFWNFQKTAQNKQLPKGRQFAQSGHPDLYMRYM